MPFTEANFASARLRTSFQFPYLSSALWNMHPIPIKDCKNKFPELVGTMAVDQYWRVYYDTEATWTVEGAAAILTHEVNHLLRDHPDRAKGIIDLRPMVWNVGADLAVNFEIRDCPQLKGTWPFPILVPEMFKLPDGKTAEWYYNELLNQACSCPQNGGGKQGQGGQQGQTNGQQQDQSGGGQQQQSGQGAPQQGQGQSGQGDPNCPVHGKHPNCGSGAHGQAMPWDQGAPSGTNPGVGQGQADLIRRKVAEDIMEHNESSKGRGTVPGNWVRWAEQVLKPKVDWRKQFPSFIRQARATASGKQDFSYQRPNRRSLDVGFILPVLRSPDIDIGVVVDTSGSIGTDALSGTLAELKGMFRQYKNCTVYSVDAGVHTAGKLTSDPRKLKLVGGGGTDMMHGVSHVAKQRRHHVCVVLTDAICPWDDTGPNMPVVIGVVNNPEFQGPSWARTVYINTKEMRVD